MSPRTLYPAILLASMALALALFAPRLGARGPEARRLPDRPRAALPPAPPPIQREATEPARAHVEVASPSPESASDCPLGMVLVDGEHCPFVAHKCDVPRKDSDVCEKYAPEVLCEGTIRPARFCIDELEYPNLRGVKPAVLVSFTEARRACETEDKRLCTIDEWQFACEGEEILPLPNGIERASGICNVDRADPPAALGALRDPFAVAGEMARIDGRVPSGSLPCASPFGVRDLTGNVEEWVENPTGSQRERPFRSAIAGGAWGRGAAACRTVDTDTPETYTSHHRGFRCCSDASSPPRDRRAREPHKSPGGFRPLRVPRG